MWLCWAAEARRQRKRRPTEKAKEKTGSLGGGRPYLTAEHSLATARPEVSDGSGCIYERNWCRLWGFLVVGWPRWLVSTSIGKGRWLRPETRFRVRVRCWDLVSGVFYRREIIFCGFEIRLRCVGHEGGDVIVMKYLIERQPGSDPRPLQLTRKKSGHRYGAHTFVVERICE